MATNNYYNNYNGGFYPNQPTQRPVVNQLLNPEEIAFLRSKPQQKTEFFVNMTEADRLSMQNTHHENGRGTLRAIGDGYYECTIDGTKFKLVPTTADISQTCEDMRNIVETIKFYYGGIDPEAGKKIYPAFYILTQIPNMWKVACKYAESYLPRQNPSDYRNEYDNFSAVNMYNQVMTGNMANPYMSMYGGYQAPQPYQQPQMMPQPQMQPQAPQMMPQYPQPQMMPQQPQAPQMMPQMPQPQMQPQGIPQPPQAPQYAPMGMPPYRQDMMNGRPQQQYAAASNPIAGAIENTSVSTPAQPTATQNVVVDSEQPKDVTIG